MSRDNTDWQATYDDEYQNALLGDVGLATRTNPNIPLKSLFPDLDSNDPVTSQDVAVSLQTQEKDVLGFLIKIFTRA